ISRNSQEVGLYLFNIGAGVLLESGFILLFSALLIILNNYRIKSQERLCLVKYGNNYKHYMEKHPRYFLFF
ncbi:MAG: hypothetical protein KAU62_01955, partial [Candidatus Heimdallarchaeota archaeon]|nr:hypothetical protein [Candidatus Heimdallarchaeota archaeon]